MSKETLIIVAVVVAVLIAVFSIYHTVRQNSPQVIHTMNVAPGSFGKGAWMKAHHVGPFAPGKTPP